MRLREIARVAGEVLGVPRERIAIKTRERGKGGSKYGQLDQRNEFIEVDEGGLRFLVNLTDYLDTGLFLDHRLVRARSARAGRTASVSSTCSPTPATASVHAAAGGARKPPAWICRRPIWNGRRATSR